MSSTEPTADCVSLFVDRTEGEPAFLAVRSGAKAVHLGEWWSLPSSDVSDADRGAARAIGADVERVVAIRLSFACGGELFVDDPVGDDERARLRVLARDDVAAFFARLRELGRSLVVARAHVLAHVRHRGDVLAGTEAVVAVDVRPFEPAQGTLAFVTRKEALGGWASGTFLPAPSTAVALRAIRHATPALSALPLTAATASFETSAWEVAPGVAMMPVRTPTLPPATHTNAFLVGNGECVLVEPASPYPEEVERLVAWVRSAEGCGVRLRAILVTHHHPDHVGGAVALKERLGAPLWGHARTAERLRGEVAFERSLADGERIHLDGSDPIDLRAIHTPGHAPGHLCFLDERSGAMIAGDMVAGVGTILVETHDGDMQLYLESLRRMRALSATMLLPAHGGVVRDPAGLLDFYVHHRSMREAKVKLALEGVGRAASLGDLVKVAYDDTPSFLWPLAERSLEAHLVKLEREGVARSEGPLWARR